MFGISDVKSLSRPIVQTLTLSMISFRCSRHNQALLYPYIKPQKAPFGSAYVVPNLRIGEILRFSSNLKIKLPNLKMMSDMMVLYEYLVADYDFIVL